ncbi:MAG: DUF2059 domain-containing protein [Methylobacterium frigidaeris]
MFPRLSPRRSLVLAGLLAALAAPASAQQRPAAPAPAPAPAPAAKEISPGHLALAKEVMMASGIARSFDSIIPAFGEQIKQAAVTRPELSKDLGDVLEKLQPEMEMQKQRMIDTASRIYATRLTEAELRDIATFFRSPSGKRYVETQPQVLDEMVQAMQTWTQEVSEYTMVRVRAEMGKRGHNLQ